MAVHLASLALYVGLEVHIFIFITDDILVDDDDACVVPQHHWTLWKPSEGLSLCRGRGDGGEDIVSRKFPEYDQRWNIHLDIQLDHGSPMFDCDPREDVHLSPAMLDWIGLVQSFTHGRILVHDNDTDSSGLISASSRQMATVATDAFLLRATSPRTHFHFNICFIIASAPSHPVAISEARILVIVDNLTSPTLTVVCCYHDNDKINVSFVPKYRLNLTSP